MKSDNFWFLLAASVTMVWVWFGGLVLYLEGSEQRSSSIQETNEYKAVNAVYPGNAVVLVVTDGCGPCIRLEDDIIPALREAGMLDGRIIVLNAREQPKLARLLEGGVSKGYPVLLVFRVKNGKQFGWRFLGYAGKSVLVKQLTAIKRYQSPLES